MDSTMMAMVAVAVVLVLIAMYFQFIAGPSEKRDTILIIGPSGDLPPPHSHLRHQIMELI